VNSSYTRNTFFILPSPPNHNPNHKNQSIDEYYRLTKVFTTPCPGNNLVSHRPFFFLLSTAGYEVLQNSGVQTQVGTIPVLYSTCIHLIIVAALHTGIRPVHTAHGASCPHGRRLKRNRSRPWRNPLCSTATGSSNGGFSRPCA